MYRVPQPKASRISKTLAIPTSSQLEPCNAGRVSSVSPRNTRSPRSSSTTLAANVGAKRSADPSRSPRSSSRVATGATQSAAELGSRGSVANRVRAQHKTSKLPVAPAGSESHASAAVASSFGETEMEKIVSAEEEAAYWRNEAAQLQKQNERLQRRAVETENLSTKVDVLIGHFEGQEETLRTNHDNDVSALREELARLKEEKLQNELMFMPGPVAVARSDLASWNWARLAVAAASSIHLKSLTSLKKHHRKSLRNKEHRESKVHTPRSSTRTPRSGMGTPTTPRGSVLGQLLNYDASTGLKEANAQEISTSLQLRLSDIPPTRTEISCAKQNSILQLFVTFVVYIVEASSARAFKLAASKASKRSRQLHETAGTYRIAAAAAEIVGQWSRLVVRMGRTASLDLCARLLHQSQSVARLLCQSKSGASSSIQANRVVKDIESPAVGVWLRFVLLAELLEDSKLSRHLVQYGVRARSLGADLVADANSMLMDAQWARLVQLKSTMAMFEMCRCSHAVAAEMNSCVRRWARLVARTERANAYKSRLGFLTEVSDMMATTLDPSSFPSDIE